MILYPLTRPNRLRLAQVFAKVPRVDISIDCVVEDQMGSAYVDSLENPQRFMVEQDRFFCYFAGDMTSDAGREFLSKTPGGRILMAGSPGWEEAAQTVFGERLRPITRYAYSSEALSITHLKNLAAANSQLPDIHRIDAARAGSNLPDFEIGAFDSPEDFYQRGIGFCAIKQEKAVGVAYSSLVCSDAIEISIVVDENYRQQGIATALSCQLLLWCLERRLDPHWDAANPESCRLAEKLGYRTLGEYGAFFLKPAG